MKSVEMRAYVHELAESFKSQIESLEAAGVFAPGEYTWQEYLADETGVEVESESELARLSDAALKQIVGVYI